MFFLVAGCASVILSLVARVLDVQLNIRELENIQTCALLYPPSMRLRNIETVSLHQVTRSVFIYLFLRNISTPAGNSDDSFHNLYVS